MAAETDKINETLLFVFSYLKEQMIAEYIKQGHNITGTLVNSIQAEIIHNVNVTVLEGSFEFYGRFVDTGRKSGTKRVPIEALEEWIKLKGFESDAKKVRGMAFAIQRKIFDVGISTPQSWRGETTKGWMTNVLNENEQRIANDIENGVAKSIEIFITNLITEAQSRFKKAA